MKILKIAYPNEGYPNHANELYAYEDEGIKVITGAVRLKKGTRFPPEGQTSHPHTEVSIIMEGKMELIDKEDNKIATLQKGDIVCLNTSELHAGRIIEEVQLVYVLSKKL